jgi:branched-chain amino acid transport system substrate-binding protein
MVLAATTGLVVGSAGAAGAASGKSPIVIGFVGDLTGVASSTFADGPGGARARVDLQNARGGVHGHKLQLIVVDDQSNPNSVVTAAQDLVESKGAFGIVTDSAFSYFGAKFEQSQGVPEMPVCPCGPPYDQQPYNNLFAYGGAASPALFNGSVWTSTAQAKFLKDIGATRLAGLGYGISAASQISVKELFLAGKSLGVTQCYTNYSVPFGGTDFTAATLQIKSAGCDSVVGSFVDSSDVALAQAVKNAGIKAQQLYFTGYDQNVLDNPSARAAFDGVFSTTGGPSFSPPNAATTVMINALKKYDPGYTGGIPDLGLWGSYVATDLMIKGLQVAGPNPTRAGFIKNLRKVSAYNADGILPTTVSFQHFGTPAMLPKHPCINVMQLKSGTWTLYKGHPFCGTQVNVGPIG